MDSFSPLAAARVLVQVLPVGPVSSSTFDNILTNLEKVGVLSLDELSEPPEAGRNTFDASTFPKGKLSFCFSTATRLPSTALLYPFETFREPFVILGIVDVKRLSDTSSRLVAESERPKIRSVDDELQHYAAQLREYYPRALLHRVLAVDESSTVSKSTPDVTGILSGASLKPFLLELGSFLIPELGGLARSFQALQNYPSPLAGDGGPTSREGASDASNGGRRGSLQLASGPIRPTDHKASNRMSMPAHMISSKSNGSPGSRPESPIRGGRASPAITFDEMSGMAPQQGIARMSTPPTASREPSVDPASSSAFGSNTLNERNRLKQQGRLSCIVGSLYLQAGLWSDALRELSDSIAKARSCSDHLWYAKAYENAMVCLLLLAWNGVLLRIPDACYPSTSRPLAARGPQTPSENPDLAQTASPEEAAETIRTLYGLLPEMIDMTRDLYLRSTHTPGEGLTPSAYSEVSVRLAWLLTGLSSGGQTVAIMHQMMQSDPAVKNVAVRRGRTLTRQASELLHSAIPPAPDMADTSATETLSILGAISACYSTLGMTRKSSLLLRDYLDCLTPSLVQARKLGAAEAGMHPAAGIAHFQEFDHSRAMQGARIDDMLAFFRSVRLLPSETASAANASNTTTDHIELRMSLLRKCIRVCEALPDFDGILKCTAELLRLAGPGTAPSLRSPDVHIKLSAEEQAMLSSNFYRTSDLMDNLGLAKQGGCYWDSFLLRGVELQPPKQGLEMIPRRSTDYSAIDTGSAQPGRGPFLHDAFAQKTATSLSQNVLVAGESSSFTVLLQNLYDLDVYIDSMELLTSQTDFCPVRRDIRLGPRRVQPFTISGTPTTTGSVTVTGCRVIVKGCAAAELKIIPEAWSAPEVTKLFAMGGDTGDGLAAHPKPFNVEAKVLPAQPYLELQGSSLSQRALEVHEGETQRLEIRIHNASRDASVNFIRITPQDNINMYLLSALKDRELAPPLRYEIERQLYVEPVLKTVNSADAQSLAPGRTASLHFELLGKPGLTHLSLQLDYAHLEDPSSAGQIYARVLSVPVTITARPSLRLASFQLGPLPQDPMGLLPPRETHCWMILGFQNVSSKALEASVKLQGSTKPYREVILPKSTGTLSCVVPKVYVGKPHATIPSPVPSRERQFVVRTSGGAPVDDRHECERFWYSNALIDAITATWQDPAGHAHGVVSLRDIALSSAEVSLLRLDDLSVHWVDEITGDAAAPGAARLKLVNRSDAALKVEVQLHRTISGFVDRVGGGPADSQLISVIKPHTEVIAKFEVTFECRGHHVFTPSVVERAHTSALLGHHLRTWHGETKHVIVS